MWPRHQLRRIVECRLPIIATTSQNLASTTNSVARRRRQAIDGGRRQYRAPPFNAFWKDLHRAVRQGDGSQAEEVVDQLLRDYAKEGYDRQSLDPRVFSMVLQAWKNSRSSAAPVRSEQLLDQMISLAEDGILRHSPTLEDYHAVLECYSKSTDHSLQAGKAAMEITQRMFQQHTPTQETVELVLSILANGGHVQSAQTFVETIGHEVAPTLAMYNRILYAWTNSKQPDAPEQAQSLLEELKSPDNGLPQPNGTSYDLVIQCWARSQQPKAGMHASVLLEEMKASKLRTTMASYNTVISVLAQQGEAEAAEQLLTRLVQDYSAQFDADLKPTLEPFQSVLLAYSKSFHPDAATRAELVLTQMRELYQAELLETQPTVFSYNLVLSSWARSKIPNATQRAQDLLEQMRTDGVLPDTTSINIVLNTLAKRGDAPATEELFWKLYQNHVEDPLQHPQPDVISFGTTMKAWVKSKHPKAPQRVEVLLQKLQDLHESGWTRCKPDVVSFSSLMQCYAKSRQRDAPQKAEAVLRRMQTLSHLQPDTVCWNSVLNTWAQAGNGERAEALFREMLENYIEDQENAAAPNVITFTAVLSAWAKTRHNPEAPRRAETLLQRMKQLDETGALPDVKPNVISYSIVLDCLAYARSKGSAERAERILRQMAESEDPHIRPNVVSYNSVIKAWSLSRTKEAVPKITGLIEELLQHVQEGNARMTPNANTFGSALKAIADSNLPDRQKRAEAVVHLMDKFGIKANEWSQKQLRRCRLSNSAAMPKRQRVTKLNMPDVPDLKYS